MDEKAKYLKYYKARSQTAEYKEKRKKINLNYRLRNWQHWVMKWEFVDIVTLFLNKKYGI